MSEFAIASLFEFAGATLGLGILAGQFDNHLWRYLCIGFAYYVLGLFEDVVTDAWYIRLPVFFAWSMVLLCIPHLRMKHRRTGSVFVTGADSGMGQATVIYLLQSNTSSDEYDFVFAGAFNAKSAQESFDKVLTVEERKRLRVVPLDVTNEENVRAAADKVAEVCEEEGSYLSGLVNYHGVAYNGPLQYMPIEMYQRQMDVNFVGNLRMCQSFLPLLRKSLKRCEQAGGRVRLIFTGTGGGPCSPCPPLLSAYMSSKFAGEAMAQSLQQELHMTKIPIRISVINPGFVKPTMLMEEGNKLTAKMWVACEEKQKKLHNEDCKIAKDEYGGMMDHFVHYAALQPGTHVSEVCKAAEHALTSASPRSSYKVGIDSKLAPIVGMLPTGVRELIARHGIYGVLSPAGTVPNYQL